MDIPIRRFHLDAHWSWDRTQNIKLHEDPDGALVWHTDHVRAMDALRRSLTTERYPMPTHEIMITGRDAAALQEVVDAVCPESQSELR